MTLDARCHAQRYEAIAREERLRFRALTSSGVQSWADAWEISVALHPTRPVVQDVGAPHALSYAHLDQDADRIAAWAIARDEERIGVRMPNGAPFLATVLGLAKAGKLAVLLGMAVPPARSAELARQCGVRTVIGEALPGLLHAPVSDLLATPWPGRPPCTMRAAVRLDDPVVVIFTSGTTGNSKPALFSHRRMIGAGIAWGIRTGMTPHDRCYIPLPLSHGNGLAVAFSTVVHAGAMAVVRERFSVRHFLPDVRFHGCTAAVYIGELWRYLETLPAAPHDANNPLQTIFGNGLRAASWAPTLERFGIRHVVEHYGATELPAGALTNWTGRPGHCGFVPPDHPDANDVLLVDETGREVPLGEPGEVLLRISHGTYRGYLDSALDETRILRNVQAPGDIWWRSGDLLARNAEGFFTFVDRIGNTFRWRGENVASADVEDAIRATGLVGEAVVFGVRLPGEEGKVGMASLVQKDGLASNTGGTPPTSARLARELEPICQHLARCLPPYAIPIFVRQVSERHPTTATLKIRKSAVEEDPFALAGVHPHVVLRQGRYVPLEKPLLDAILEGHVQLRPGLGVVDVR